MVDVAIELDSENKALSENTSLSGTINAHFMEQIVIC